jgi:hypothetical protein
LIFLFNGFNTIIHNIKYFSSPILVVTEPLLYTVVAHTAREKWQQIGFFCSLCEELAKTPHRAQTSNKLVTEHWQECQVIPNTEATCINFYYPKRSLTLPPLQ